MSWRQFMLTEKALQSGNISPLETALIFTKRNLQIQKPYQIAKGEKYDTIVVNLAPKWVVRGRQLAVSSSSVTW